MRPARCVPGSRVAIIGTGLIGTSIGLALLARSRRQIVGWDPRKAALRTALARRGITRAAHSFAEALDDADVIVLSAPSDAIATLVRRAIRSARRGALIIDTGSIKAPVVAAAASALAARRDVLFVGGHPMAGREFSGARYAEASLFIGRPFALVAPPQHQRARALSAAEAFVRRLRAVPVGMTAREHDRVVAATSALPQLAAVALTLAIEDAARSSASRLAGPGYRDATRLAQSPFRIWRPLVKANAAEIGRALRFMERIQLRLRAAVDHGDEGALARLFSRAAQARRRVVAD